MRDVVYVASISVDGYLGAEDADDAWVVPDPELHRHFNDLDGLVRHASVRSPHVRVDGRILAHRGSAV